MRDKQKYCMNTLYNYEKNSSNLPATTISYFDKE